MKRKKRVVKPSYRFYRGTFRFARALLGIFFRFDVVGKENIPDGAAMVCANHSSVIDPILIAFALGIDCPMYTIAKISLFRIPLFATVVSKLGAISVDRSRPDVTTIKAALGYLRNGDKVVIFPEGRRVAAAESVEAKQGAVKLAERAGAPIVPIFIPRKKPLFSKVTLVVGQPYHIEKRSGKRTLEEYLHLAADLMNRIEGLDIS